MKPGALLIVDDEESVRSMIATNLRRSGYEVLEARNAEEGLTMAAQHGGQLALLITDVRLHGMLGLELASRLTNEVKVLIISGEPTDAGNAPVLEKPFTRAELLRRVVELVNEQHWDRRRVEP